MPAANKEFSDLMSQNATSSWGGTRKLPCAFTEHGVAMLSGVLSSDTAIRVNIMIMRAFVAMRQYALGYAELKQQLDFFMQKTNLQLNEIYQALTELAAQKREAEKPRKPIGYQHLPDGGMGWTAHKWRPVAIRTYHAA
ncbi:MAG: ORF6N domain-containing protein [Prevotellaceae bacterium]|nr:ORF6N domain-containing protein [Prevotellaceae bacterium]